ncbi:MAG: acetyltransferase [Candidatus Gottesmanbacteria bacterium GW2011_GWA2_43_14]|uniref:Acetyltransferase n=1 Tax=Candidatus Gottesmanbacteria bacterium GW2011_GWA2_43_14 TaxID=1618443 RepID=A0A0G1DM26_9BACT|nr:MAG: acetyltransferase [Candidatus Gottesmanbacteria bacterium GW2011_GWA2_43_14]
MRDKMGRQLTTGELWQKSLNRILNIFLDIELMFLRLASCIPSHLIRQFIYRLAGISLGRGSTIHMWCNFYNPVNITIGEDTIIGDNVFLDGRSELLIGNHVDIASQVLIYNSEHDVNSEDFSATLGTVKIEDYVFVGPRAIILPGVTVGRGAVVAAGAVVTRDVPPFTIAGGVPAKPIGERKNKNPKYRLGRARLFQ